VLDLAVARDGGMALRGESPINAIRPIPDSWVVQELRASLEWHLRYIHDSFHDPTGGNAVLNTCRAVHWLSTTRFVSKSAGARWFHGERPTPIVARALAARATGRGQQLDATLVRRLVLEGLGTFDSA
jgi:hypothetical protein